eukprot:1188139-Prorocentrum_minimum.AAC.2
MGAVARSGRAAQHLQHPAGGTKDRLVGTVGGERRSLPTKRRGLLAAQAAVVLQGEGADATTAQTLP